MKKIENVLTVEMMESAEINEVKIGGKVVSLTKQDGNARLDKVTGQQAFKDGVPQYWADSHYIEFAFQGGTSKFKVDSSIFSTLELNKRYQMFGRSFMKTPYGDGQSYLTIEPIRFDFLF